MKNSIVAVGSDHAGFQLKERIKAWLETNDYRVKDFGTYSEDSVDYPDYVHPLAEYIESGESPVGIVICGSGNGVNMTVNKHQKIRSALCWEPELAKMARLHNDANVLALSARYVNDEVSMKCVEEFMNTNFEGGRHERRVNKISCS
ncbi:MAG TPA: ribose 5-phosphate isomerase B [Flavobacteriales bacterium]|nr:ribose 5-phosphate isomerase B [Flavobacteriales bacterium]